MEEPITEKPQIRLALVNDLTTSVITQLRSTMYHFIEIKELLAPPSILDVIYTEIDVLYLEAVTNEFKLNSEEYCLFHDAIIEVVRTQHHVLTSQCYKGESPTIFKLHSVVFTEAQIGPTAHPVKRISVTAGCGEVAWDGYSSMEQLDIIDFSYNLKDRVGLLSESADIVLNPLRYTTQFDIKDVVGV